MADAFPAPDRPPPPSSADRPPPPDQAARDRIGSVLDQTLFVEAGAGSGKTTALVDRVRALVTEPADPTLGPDPVPLASVAAITFTEKAGAELRERLRRTLEQTIVIEGDTARAAACRAALDDLDGAAIGTLHSFAQRILSEHPVEAGLPPRVEVLDEVTSGVEFERRWARFSDDLFEDPAYERTLLLLFASGTRDTTPHALARTFNRNWDLVEERVDPDHPAPPSVHDLAAAAFDAVDEACRHRATCGDPTDRLCLWLDDVAEWAAAARDIDDEVALLEAIAGERRKVGGGRLGFRPGGAGAMKAWGSKDAKAAAAEALREAGDALDAVAGTVAAACAHHLGSAIRHFTLTSAQERRRAGALEFHDLLVLARAVLRHPTHGARVRSALHDHYQRLLLDEFQDTDPIQIELAVRIIAADPASEAARSDPWDQVEVAPGRLFVVGDPKQSIYRFRRADIALFMAASRRFSADGPPVTLSTNFRTVDGVIDWVNTTFTHLLAEAPVNDLLVDSQPAYAPLTAVRRDPPSGPPVAVLGRDVHDPSTRAAAVRQAEAADVVATIQRAVAEPWAVGDGAGGWRDATLGDVTILVPARTSLPYLEDALTEAGIAYRAEASSLVYATRAVRDLLMVVRAVADPTDELRVVSALRSPLFGCGDDDLYRFRVERGGRWSYLGRQPETVPADDPVAAGLAVLAGWHHQRVWTSPPALIETIARDRRALELAFAEGRPRDVWRRIRFVIDQARAWSDATGGDLRDYLDWVAHQTVEGARVAEAVLPETDDDAVRIMTIHAAKGLEFPITIVSGLSSGAGHGPRAGDARFPPEGGVAYYLGKNAETPEFAASRPVDEQMAFDERVRLLYVATTRARDHLVVSLHRAARKHAPSSPATRTNAELLVDGMGEAVLDALTDAADHDLAPGPAARATPVAPPEPYEIWAEAHVAALIAARRPTTVAATALTDEGRPDVEPPDDAGPSGDGAGDGLDLSSETEPTPGDQLALDLGRPRRPRDLDVAPDGEDAGLRKRPGDLDRPPWLKGRYGTAVGRAVHGVLQTVDLGARADDPALDHAVAAQCQAEAVPDRADTVRELVGQALASPSVVEAATAPHWREIYASTPIGGPDGRLLEGYVDLLYRSPEGLVVVDYKTAATAEPAELDRRVAGYRRQGAAYALTVARATGEPVVRVTFCFLTPEGVVERDLEDLAAATAEVEAAVVAGQTVEAG